MKCADPLLSQTRLDRIAHPTNLYLRSWLTWYNRLNSDARYTLTELKARLDEIAPQVGRMKRTHANPPEEMSAQAWLNLDDRIAILEGQIDAIQAVMRIKGKKILRSASPSSVTTCVPSTLGVDAEPEDTEKADPFALE